MTVKTLIKKLLEMPMDSKVIFVNTDVFINGTYEVTEVDDMEDGTVCLDSDHENNYWEDWDYREREE